jgi:hypothetical protein
MPKTTISSIANRPQFGYGIHHENMQKVEGFRKTNDKVTNRPVDSLLYITCNHHSRKTVLYNEYTILNVADDSTRESVIQYIITIVSTIIACTCTESRIV